MKITLASFALALTFSLAAPIVAQNNSIFEVSPSQNKTSYDLGVASVYRNAYVGSDTTSTIVLPYATGIYKGRYFFNPALGAGVYAINNDKVRLAASTHLALGRDGEDTPFSNQAFAEEFDVKSTLTTKISGRIYLPIAAFDVVGTLPLTGGLAGARLDTLLTTSVSPTERLRITPGVRATFTTSGWMNTNYGIDNTQALASGLNTFDTGDGLSTIGAHAALFYKLNKNYEVVGVINHSWLMGDVKESPLISSDTGITAAVGLSRKF